MCGGQCTTGNGRCGGTCHVGCNYYCLYNNCGFECGGDAEIKTNIGCGSSSCSATGRE